MQRYIQTDIRGYSPAPGDLAYPDKLLVAAQVAVVEASLEGTPDTTDSDSVFETSGTEVHVQMLGIHSPALVCVYM